VPGTGLEMTAYRRGWHVLLPEEGTRDRAGGHLVLLSQGAFTPCGLRACTVALLEVYLL
jgi:hypothetical protein